MTHDDDGYNGWTNYETWNVALWIQNTEGLYNLARRYDDYRVFLSRTGLTGKTPDGVAWNDDSLDIDELDTMLEEL